MNISRRDFLKGTGMATLGMGMFPVMNLLGITASAEEAQAAAEKTADSYIAAAEGRTLDDLGATANEEVLKSDDLMQAVLNESEVTSDVTLPDGTVVPAVYVRMRNRINRIGRGIGSIPNASSYQMIMYLWSEEDAENYLKMPLHKYFTAANYAEITGLSDEEALAILEDQAARNLIWRVRRGGLAWFVLMPYINGFWEFGELQRAYAGDVAAVAEFDTQGVISQILRTIFLQFKFSRFPVGFPRT